MPYRCPVADSVDCSLKSETMVECFACGEPVCKACSVTMLWYNYGIKRIDVDCAREEVRARTGVMNDDIIDRILQWLVQEEEVLA